MDNNASRFILTPNPVALAGQKNVPLDLRPGESLYSFLHRHVPGLDDGKWVAVVNGNVIDRHEWFTFKPKDGQLIELRGDVAGKSVLMIVAMVALTVFTFGIGAAAAFSVYGAATAAGMGAMAATMAATAVYMAGAMLIQKVLGPKQDSPSAGQDVAKNHSLSGTSNRMRPYEPFGLLFGVNVRIAPDVLSRPYGYFQGDDQYMDLILTPGFNVHSVGAFMNGTTPLNDYQDVKVYHNGFSGMPSVDIPMMTNTLELPGGKLSADDKGVPGEVIKRTTGPNTIKFLVGISYTLYGTTRKGKESYNQETIIIRYKKSDESIWKSFSYFIRNIDKKEHRINYTFEVPEGTYDIEVQAMGQNSTGDGDQQSFQLTSIVTVRPDEVDYRFVPRIGINMKATGQLNGAPNELTTHATSKPTPVWKGNAWVTESTSNPGAHILQYLRGIYSDEGELLAGMGLPDDEIDIESLKAFMLHCAANGFEYRYWITDTRSHENVMQSIAGVGMGQMSTAGGRWSASWSAEDQPFNGVVNMATITEASFQVDYTLANAADGIEYTYFDATTEKVETVRVKAPTSDTDPINPATLRGEGVSDPVHAAKLGRYHLGQSLFQYKDISYGTTAEALSYKRLDKLLLQHDLTQWGFGGRVVSAQKLPNGNVSIVLDEMVPELATPWLGVRALGERMVRTFRVQPFLGTTDTLTLIPTTTGGVVWPADMPFPTTGSAPNFLWMYDIKATPGYPVRVVSIDPDYDSLAKVNAVWEGPEFWEYVYRGNYQRPNNESLLKGVEAQNLTARDYQVVQGNTKFTEVQLDWEVLGVMRDANVYMAGEDGILRQIGTAITTRTLTVRIDYPQTYTFVVTPFNPSGTTGKSARINYTPVSMGDGPVLVDLFDVEDRIGGVRRYTWGFSTGTIMSPDFAGVEIRYTAGNVTTPVWEDMTTLGDEDGFFTSAVEAVIPPAGTWTFSCRSRDTSSNLSVMARTIVKTLKADIGQNVDDSIKGVEQNKTDLEKEINDRIDGDKAAVDKAAAELKEVNDRLSAEAAQNAQDIIKNAQDIFTNTNNLAQEIIDRASGDLNTEVSLTTKINTETTARENDVENLTRMISSISAGSGEQFDIAPKSIWYFDTTTEGWGSNGGNPTIEDGFLRPVNNSAAYAQSPVGLGINGSSYRFLKLRMKRVGNPQWLGLVRWTTDADQTWNDAKSVTIPAPTFDANGIANVEIDSMGWNSGSPVRQIRIAFTYVQSANSYVMYDWIAVGRPTPGASVAMVQEEAQARITADAAEATRRETLGVQLRGTYEGSDVAGVSQGLIASEKNARIDGDQVNATAIQTLTARMPAGSGKVATEASVTSLQQAMVTADTALGQRVDSLSARVDGKADSTALAALTTRVSTAEGKIDTAAQSITQLTSQIGNTTNYTVFSNGGTSSNPSGSPRGSGIYRANGTTVAGAARGIRVVPINADNTLNVSVNAFDIYGNAAVAGQAFNDWYDALADDTWFIMYSSDSVGNLIGTGDIMAGVRTRLMDAGMSSANSQKFSSAVMAVMVGRKGLGSGGGIQVVSREPYDTTNTRKGLWASMTVSLMGGVPVGAGDGRYLDQTVQASAQAVTSLTTRVTQAEGKIDAQAIQLTSLTANMNTAMMGSGASLWENPTFDYGMAPWTQISTGGTTGNTVEWANNSGQQGGGITITRGNVMNVGVGSNNRRWTSVEVGQAGRRIRQTIVARSLSGSDVRAVLRLRVRSAAGEGNTDSAITVTPNWARYTATHTIGDDRNEVMGELHVGQDPGVIVIDRFEAFDVTQELRIDAQATAITQLTAQVTAQGDLITATSNSVTSLTSKVNGLRVLGDSLVPNNNFATDFQWWVLGGNSGGNTILRGATSGDGGPGVTINRTTAAVAPFMDANDGQFSPCKPGTTFRSRLRSKLLSGNGNVLTRIIYRDAANVQQQIDRSYTAPSDWADTELTYPLPATAVRFLFRIYVHPSIGQVSFDQINLFDVTDQLANEANATAITSLTTQVTQLGNTVTAQAQQITTLESNMSGFMSMGENLLVNPDFQIGLAPWSTNNTGANVTWSATNGDGRPGVLMNKNSAINPVIQSNGSRWQATQPGRRMRAVVRAKGTGGANNLMIRLRRRNVDGSTNSVDSNQTFSTTAFETKTVDFAVFAATVTGWVLEVYCYPSNATVLVDNVALYDITDSVAIDAQATAVQALTTRVQNVEGVASANATAITSLNTRMGNFSATNWTQMQADITATKNATTALSTRVDGVSASLDGKAEASVVVGIQAQVKNLGGEGGNLIPNSAFSGWQRTGWGYRSNQSGWSELGNPTGGDAWNPPGVEGIGGVASRVVPNGQNDWFGMDSWISVEAGKTYCVSAYMTNHRCRMLLYAEFYNQSGQIVGSMGPAEQEPFQPSPVTLDNMRRAFGINKAPAGAVMAKVLVRVQGTGASTVPYFWLFRPMFGLVADGATQPPPWNASGMEASAQWSVNMRADNRIAGLRLGVTGGTSAFDVIADVFRISKPEGGARTEFSDGNWRVYDGNGVLRVRMGVGF